MDYVRSVPGGNSRADAVNLLLASINGQDEIAETIVDRQPEGCLVPVLGSMTAILILLFLSNNKDDREHFLRHFADAALSDGPMPPVAESARAPRARAARVPVSV